MLPLTGEDLAVIQKVISNANYIRTTDADYDLDITVNDSNANVLGIVKYDGIEYVFEAS